MAAVALLSSAWSASGQDLSGNQADVPTPPGAPSIVVVGEERVVFSWKADRCNDDDTIDAPLRAVRLRDGSVFALAPHHANRSFRGPSIENLTRDCDPVYQGAHDSSPASHNDRTWIMSMWTRDGLAIEALGHNEYQAWRRDACNSKLRIQCNYDSIVALRSTNGGRTFERVSKTPIAASRYMHDQRLGRIRGFLHPSNIVAYRGALYSIAQAMPDGPQRGGECLFRTEEPENPGSWTYFDGEEFVASAMDPYSDAEAPPPCRPLARLGGIVWSVLKHDSKDEFIAILTMPASSPDRLAIGASLSRDLVHWSKPQPFLTVPGRTDCASAARYNYPSLLDPNSKSPNFDTVGSHALLFLTRLNLTGCRVTLDRDIVAVPVRIDWPTAE